MQRHKWWGGGGMFELVLILHLQESVRGVVAAVCGNGFGLANQMLLSTVPIPAPSARGCVSL